MEAYTSARSLYPQWRTQGSRGALLPRLNFHILSFWAIFMYKKIPPPIKLLMKYKYWICITPAPQRRNSGELRAPQEESQETQGNVFFFLVIRFLPVSSFLLYASFKNFYSALNQSPLISLWFKLYGFLVLDLYVMC